jgi:hypothetical protein
MKAVPNIKPVQMDDFLEHVREWEREHGKRATPEEYFYGNCPAGCGCKKFCRASRHYNEQRDG